MDGNDLEQIHAELKAIVGMGLVNLDQVEALTAQLSQARRVLRSDLVQTSVEGFAGMQVQGESAALLKDIVVDAYLTSGTPVTSDKLNALTFDNDKVQQFFGKKATAVMDLLGANQMEFLDPILGAVYQRAETMISSSGARRAGIVNAARKETRRSRAPRKKASQRPRSPASPKREKTSTMRSAPPTMKSYCMAPTSTRSWTGASADLGEQIAAVRHGCGPRCSALAAAERDTVDGTNLRRRRARPDVPADRIPSRIEAMLAGWGVDIDAFAPEIDSALYGTIGIDEIRQWRSEIDFNSQFKLFKMTVGTPENSPSRT